MNKNLVNTIGSTGQDNLIARLLPPALTTGVKIAAGEGELKRGTVLTVNESGVCVVYGKAANTDEGEDGETTVASGPAYILADDVDASGSEDAAAVAYHTGNFNPDAIIVAEGYVLTAADKDGLRKYGIVFTDMMKA